MTVSSIGPEFELGMLPMKSGRGEDRPDALLGSVEVMYMKGAEPHS
jgi:hypothetical protein